MASEKTADATGAGLTADPAVAIPRISNMEVGFTGLRITNGTIIEEQNRIFRYPAFLKVVNEARTEPVIASALSVYRMLMSRVGWTVMPPEDATDTDKKRAEILETMMCDMEGTWPEFISEITTYLEYGFAIQEKVFRRRLTRNGSKYNDGLVGLRKLAPRGQDTIRHFNFSEDGRTLVSVGQSLRNMENGYRYQNLTANKDGLLEIAREKFMLFTCDGVKGNPIGRSLLQKAYLPYKQLTMVRDQMFLGISKDLAAIPVVKLPAKIMDSDADDADKATYLAYQTLINNVAAGQQRGIIVPSMVDPDTKTPLFDFSLLESRSTSKFNLPEIVKQLEDNILVAMSVNILKDGAEDKLTVMAVEHRLNEIRDVLNHDLIPQLYALNGWSQENLPTFEFGDIVDVDIESFGKFVQQAFSVGAIEADRVVMNRVRKVFGVDPLPDDQEVDKEALPGNMSNQASKAGKGMASPTGDGTRKDAYGNKNSSTANANNK
jgi:hypothetical protein